MDLNRLVYRDLLLVDAQATGDDSSTPMGRGNGPTLLHRVSIDG